jgi:hypothetical protein
MSKTEIKQAMKLLAEAEETILDLPEEFIMKMAESKYGDVDCLAVSKNISLIIDFFRESANGGIIEIRFKEKNQYVAWEDLPIMMTVPSDRRGKLLSLAIASLKKFYLFVELRWNYKGSHQGYYVDGNVPMR